MDSIDVSSLIKVEGVDDERVRYLRGGLFWKMFKTMIAYWKEILFLFFVMIATYAAIQTSPLKTKKASFPIPFFPPNSMVVDHFLGDIYRAFEQVQYSDITFIMFYAPWDAASMDLRWEFEKAARYFYNQVYFAAVNCWWPNGDCKQHFPKIRSFPLLIAYHSNGKGIAFHGTPTLPYLVRFLNQFIHPIGVVRDTSDIFNLLAKRDAVVLGYFDYESSSMPDGYLTFYSAALKTLEKAFEQIEFAVVTNSKDALRFGLNTSGSIDMYLWNGKLSFNGNGSFTWQKLLNWIYFNKTQVLKWVSLPYVKSNRLAEFLESSSPTLILLTPRFVTTNLDWSPYFYMLKAIALEYFNCNNSDYMNDSIISIRAHLDNATYDDSNLISHCTSLRYSDCRMDYKSHCCISVRNVSQQSLKKYSVCVVSEVGSSVDNLCELLNLETRVELHFNHFGCQVSSVKYSSHHYLQTCVYSSDEELASHVPLCEKSETHQCALLNASDVHPGLNLRPIRKRDNILHVSSQGCWTNRTLKFVVLDSLRFGILFEKIGIKVSLIPSKTAVAIIHAKHETQYVLHEEVTDQNLRKFIWNFTRNELPRYCRSLTSSKMLNTSSRDNVTVFDVTSSNFNKIVMNTTKDVVLLVYAPWCAACFGINHIYLSVARYFQPFDDILFIRINREENDLSWEFTVQNYPTIIIFPGTRKSDSESFPVDMPITTQNLIHFVLAHAQSQVKLRTVLSHCSGACITHNRRLTMEKISSLLGVYRSLDRQLTHNVIAINRECRNSTFPEMLQKYVENARYLVQRLCGVRTKLASAKLLYLKLSTEDTHRISPKYFKDIISDHGLLSSNNSHQNQCEDFVYKLNREVDRCSPEIVESFSTMDIKAHFNFLKE